MNLSLALYHSVIILFLSSSFIADIAALAKTTPQTRIRVTLLGQLCSLQGPFDESTLETIHGIGPAQLYPVFSLSDPATSQDHAKKAFEKLRATTSLPSSFGAYKEKATKRLDAHQAFFQALTIFRRTRSTLSLENLSNPYIMANNRGPFETFVKNLKNLKVVKNKDIAQLEQLFELYNKGIEPDPEEEFHRAIKKLDIQYRCSFEDSDL